MVKEQGVFQSVDEKCHQNVRESQTMSEAVVTPGFSEEARFIQRTAQEGRKHLRSSNVLGTVSDVMGPSSFVVAAALAGSPHEG